MNRYPHREEKLAMVHRLMTNGLTGYAANKACKKKYGSGLGYKDLRAIRIDLEQERQRVEDRQAQEVVEVSLPSEIQEVPSDPFLYAPPSFQDALRVVQSWMAERNVEKVVFAQDGTVSVLAWHQITAGGSTQHG